MLNAITNAAGIKDLCSPNIVYLHGTYIDASFFDDLQVSEHFVGYIAFLTGLTYPLIHNSNLNKCKEKSLSQADFYFLKKLGHCPHIEKPDAVAVIINDLINDLADG